MKINSQLSHRSIEPERRILYLVGTPIGNLNDISPRAINILRNVNYIACEDTRQTKKIMNKYLFNNNLISFNKYNAFKKIPKLIEILKDNKSIAIVSDAGMPSISDPGEEFVKAVRSEGFDVICIPGASAAITALVCSGLPCSRFVFEGFLPKKNTDRKKILSEISKSEKTTIVFESPHRLKSLLKDLLKFCGGDREIAIARELTKKFEEHYVNDINSAIIFFEEREVVGEITVVIKGICKTNTKEIDLQYVKEELHELIECGLSLSSASKYLARKKKLPKSLIYNLY